MAPTTKPPSGPTRPPTTAEVVEQQKQQIEAQRKDIDRLDKARKAQGRLGSFESFTLAQCDNWQLGANRIGQAYAIAAREHKDAVDRQTELNALRNQIMFSALSVFAVGGLSWISSFAQNRFTVRMHDLAKKNPRGQPLDKDAVSPISKVIEALEDSVQAGNSEALTSIAPVVTLPAMDAVSEDPLVYQKELENKVLKVKMIAQVTFGQIKQKWSEASLDAWDKFDLPNQEKVYSSWQRESAELIGVDQLMDLNWIAIEFERLIWRRFILEYHSHREILGKNITSESYDYVGDEIVKRLRDIGITVEAGVSPDDISGASGFTHDVPAKERVTARLANWAATVRPRPILKALQPPEKRLKVPGYRA